MRAYGEVICSGCGKVLKAISTNEGSYADKNKIERVSIKNNEDEVICRCSECNTENKIILRLL